MIPSQKAGETVYLLHKSDKHSIANLIPKPGWEKYWANWIIDL
jgi:hypothetical protein